MAAYISSYDRMLKTCLQEFEPNIMRLVEREDFGWAAEYFEFDFPAAADVTKEPNEKVLIDMIPMLLDLVAKGPQQPPRLSEQQRSEIATRIRMGESAAVVAAYYKVDIGPVRELVKIQ